MKKIILKTFLFSCLILCFLLIFKLKTPIKGAMVIEQPEDELNVLGWAWSENIGWISFNSKTDNQSSVEYGVKISTSTGYLSGYAWSGNIGWISFNRNETGVPPSDDPCPTGGCIAKVEDVTKLRGSETKVIGWARVISVCPSLPCNTNDNEGGWDGWIKLGDSQNSWVPQVSIASNGDFHGWAWSGVNSASSSVLGWISFNGSDSGAGGSYKVWLEFPTIPSPPISVNFSWQPERPFAGERVKFINETQCPSGVSCQYEWQFEDGTPPTSTEENPIVVFNSPGEKDVTLKVTLSTGPSNSLTKKVKVLPRAVPTGSIFEKLFAKIFSFIKNIF